MRIDQHTSEIDVCNDVCLLSHRVPVVLNCGLGGSRALAPSRPNGRFLFSDPPTHTHTHTTDYRQEPKSHAQQQQTTRYDKKKGGRRWARAGHGSGVC